VKAIDTALVAEPVADIKDEIPEEEVDLDNDD
jgi:hypothetical protein